MSAAITPRSSNWCWCFKRKRTLQTVELPDWRAVEGMNTELSDHRYDPERPWQA